MELALQGGRLKKMNRKHEKKMPISPQFARHQSPGILLHPYEVTPYIAKYNQGFDDAAIE